MAFVNVFDTTDEMDIVCFGDQYEENGGCLYKGSTIMMKGYRSKKNSFVLEEALQI